MKAAALIKEVRESTQHLYDSYQKYLETDGKMGLCCFDPDLLEERLKRSDRDIIEQGLAKGVYIEDAEEFVAKLGRLVSVCKKGKYI